MRDTVIVAAVITLSLMLLLSPSACSPNGGNGNKPDGDMGLRGPPTDNGGGAGGSGDLPPPPVFDPDDPACPPFPGDEESGIEGGPPWKGEGEEE
jgi:hypothetical protein